MTSISRRSFVQHACAASCACGASLSAAAVAPATAPLNVPELGLLPRDAVQLTGGPMLRQFTDQQRLYLSLDDDALLKPFRQRAGQPAPGADMGGWYDDAKDFFVDPQDWSTANWHGFIPGHSFGQYLSALSRGYAITRDAATRRKVQDLVDKYAATISPRFFDDYNLPAYTFDKLVVGLLDAHQHAGVTSAHATLDRLVDTALPFLPEKALTWEERRARPHKREAQTWDETYTLPENLFLAARAGLGDRYLSLAQRYLPDAALFDPLAAGRSPFKGKHAYSHVNSLSSAIAAYRQTKNPKYLDAARNGFRFVQAQSFATGGWGPGETLLAPDDQDGLLKSLENKHQSFETPCGAYAHFKLTRSLLQIEPDSRYGDSMERVLYNTILGAWPTRANGDTFYYSDYTNTATKFYRKEAWPCCSGTFAQVTADYGISTCLVADGGRGLYVNLYAPSRVTTGLGGQRVTVIQETNYPATNASRFTIEAARPARFAISLRIPAWSGPATRIRTNGEVVRARPAPHGFWTQTRTWKSGDVIEIEFDMTPRLEPLNAAHPELAALLVGPTVLFPVEAPDEALTRGQLLAARRIGDDEWRAQGGSAEIRLKPFTAIGSEQYRLYSRLQPS
ncbi:MAG TPA: beta-L-arabinofuranosidase domain-containing protein [Steroidobacteraceae bacterium]|nr:beta-L-arabinofuranosidase domain-containing protein [Steroidobacteraceae bacterium]